MIKRQLLVLGISIFLFTSCEKEKQNIGTQIDGDFNGDEKSETAILKFVNAKNLDNDILFEYSVIFSDSTIKSISLENNFRRLQLINEGDLNDDKAEDISISYEIPSGVPVSRMETRSFNNDKWVYIIPFLDMSIHFGFDNLSLEKLQNIVRKEGKSIHYYTYGNSFQFDNNNFKPINLKRTNKTISIK
jgi:hypothetical protein